MDQEGGPVERLPSSAGMSISVVASRTGVTVTTLRMWQSRYGLGPSHRSAGGHRRYDEGDVERLLAVKQLVDRGASPAEAARSVLAAPRQLLELASGTDPVAHEIGRAALELDGPAVRRLLARKLAEDPVESVWEGVLRPVLAAIGDDWPAVAHGIAVEHLLSHVVASELATITGPHSVDASEVLLASAPEELHDLPLAALRAVLASTGRVGTLLGARTPIGSLAAAAARAAPVAVVVLALTPDVADLSVLTAMASSAVVAAGPGWDPTLLPEPVTHVDGLAEAVNVLAALTGARAADPGPRATRGIGSRR
ncbi:MAG: MerR family transcriptional regulator [Pseudonocardia sp.]|nr:MerR family transcriptional regulator [Pseudonocardia sp.]